MLYFDSEFAFLYGEFQNFRLRRYLESIFLIVIQNRARLRRFIRAAGVLPNHKRYHSSESFEHNTPFLYAV